MFRDQFVSEPLTPVKNNDYHPSQATAVTSKHPKILALNEYYERRTLASARQGFYPDAKQTCSSEKVKTPATVAA